MNEPKQPDLAKMPAAKLRLRIQLLDAEYSASTKRLIAAGLGMARGSDIAELAKGSSLLAKVRLAKEHMQIRARLNAARDELDARKRYHGKDTPIRRSA